MKKILFFVASVLISGVSLATSVSQKVFMSKSSDVQIEQQKDDLLVLAPSAVGSADTHYGHSSHHSHSSHSSHRSHFSSR